MSISSPEDAFEVPVFNDTSRLDEAALETFEDEAPIRHDVVPVESDSDGDEECGDIVVFQKGQPEAFAVGQVYNGKNIIHRMVLEHGLDSGCNLMKYRHDTNKIGFKCVGGGCLWKVYAANVVGSDKWEIRVSNNSHSCLRNGVCKMLKVSDIARLFVDKIREEPELYMPRKIQATILGNWGINASRPQCQAARRKALKWIADAYADQFSRLREYAAEVMHWNPNSTVDIETISTSEGVDVFDKIYICYGEVKKSWKDNCRPLIGVDGCFLRSNMKGQLLVALGRDGNNQIYPIAWCVVQKENKVNWQWFLKKLKSDLDLEDGSGFVVVSDRQKGLLKAVELELPLVEHRMCVRHIYSNLKKKHGKKPDLKMLLWKLSWSYSSTEYQENLHQIELWDSGVHASVLDSKPETYCRAFQLIGSCCEDVDNNSVESFNATITKAREKPLVPMLEMIARLAMVRIFTRSFTAINHEGILTPYAADILGEQHVAASECVVHRSTNNQHQVIMRDCAYRVCLESRTCTCRKWDLRGIPCEHAYGVIIHRKLKVEEYVQHWFRRDKWVKTYAEGISPTRGSRFWPHVAGPKIHRPPSPTQTGRKKKNMINKQKRKKGFNESPTKRQPKLIKRSMHCSICKGANHNSRSCKKGQTSLSQGDPSASQEVPLIMQSQEL